MSQENVEVVRRALAALDRRDVEAVSRLVAMEGGYHGHEGIRHWWQNLLGAFPDYTLETVEARAVGHRTLTTLRTRGHGADSDTPVEDTVWVVVDWRDKKVVRWRVLSTEAEALEAVGLSD